MAAAIEVLEWMSDFLWLLIYAGIKFISDK